MSLNSLRFATVLVLVFIVCAYVYPEGILRPHYILQVISLYLIVLVIYLEEESQKKANRSWFKKESNLSLDAFEDFVWKSKRLRKK